MGKKSIKAVYDKNSTHIGVLHNFCLSNCSENFQLIFKLTSAEISRKVLKKLASKNYAKYWFNYEQTLASPNISCQISDGKGPI